MVLDGTHGFTQNVSSVTRELEQASEERRDHDLQHMEFLDCGPLQVGGAESVTLTGESVTWTGDSGASQEGVVELAGMLLEEYLLIKVRMTMMISMKHPTYSS